MARLDLQKRNDKYIAVVTLGYDGKKRKTKSKLFDRKIDAINYLPQLQKECMPAIPVLTFRDAYARMIELHSTKVGESTIRGYNCACKWFSQIENLKMDVIKSEHLQSCVDSCTAGRRTKEMMRNVASLTFKYAMQNDMASKNYAQFLYLGKGEKKERQPFTMDEVRKIYEASSTVPYADYILCLIFTGFRPDEMLNLKKENFHGTYFIGGEKTKAGRDRIVPIPKIIMPIVERQMKGDSEYIFPAPEGGFLSLDLFRKKYYYAALKEIGVRPLSPYSCRHTFATMLKEIDAPITDKQEIMGHASFEMTAHYTHTDVSSLERIAERLTLE